jgi:hypothetical protein
LKSAAMSKSSSTTRTGTPERQKLPSRACNEPDSGRQGWYGGPSPCRRSGVFRESC